MFVMGGALAVFMPGYFLLIRKQQKPLNAETFCLASQQTIEHSNCAFLCRHDGRIRCYQLTDLFQKCARSQNRTCI